MTMLRRDLLHGRGDARFVDDVERDRFDGEAFALQFERGFDRLGVVAPREDHVRTLLRELADCFESDATRGAGDEGNFLGHGCISCWHWK